MIEGEQVSEPHTEGSGFESTRLISPLLEAISHQDSERVYDLVQEIHPADIADLLEQLSHDQRQDLVTLTPQLITPDVLVELEEDTRKTILPLLSTDYLARAIAELESDDAAMLADEFEEDQRREVLKATPEQARKAVEAALAFDEESAGRLMRREFVAAPPFWTVQHVLDDIHRHGTKLPDMFFEIYIVDPGFKPIGVIDLSEILRARREDRLEAIMRAPQIIIQPDMDQEDVAYLFKQYHLVSAPVTDEQGRLTGMITVDDALEVLEEENREDMLALAGVSESGLADTVWRTARVRAPWLLVNLVTIMAASFVIKAFEGSIAQMVALAVLMPVVASLAGNAGTQALAVVVRALAERDLTRANALRVHRTGGFCGFS